MKAPITTYSLAAVFIIAGFGMMFSYISNDNVNFMLGGAGVAVTGIMILVGAIQHLHSQNGEQK